MAEAGRASFRDRGRAESFGSIAAAYDRARPGYPQALIVDLAARGGVRALDVGCGTGKAAVPLARAGLHVLGVEIDAAMAAVARDHGIEVEVASFEQWDPAGRTFDLITCGQAWHWVDPGIAVPKVAALLERFGTLALFWNVHSIAAEQAPALDAVYARIAPELGGRTSGGGSASAGAAGSAVEPLEAAGLHVRTREYPWDQEYRRDDWLELLSTFSDHHLLPGPRRAELLAALGAAVDEMEGRVTVHYRTYAVIAQRR